MITWNGQALTVQTAASPVDVHLGPEWCWDANGIALAEGDDLVVVGFTEGDTFEVVELENSPLSKLIPPGRLGSPPVGRARQRTGGRVGHLDALAFRIVDLVRSRGS